MSAIVVIGCASHNDADTATNVEAVRSVGPGGLFLQTNLAADEPGVAVIQDPSLVNAWGVTLGPTSGFFVSSNVNGTGNLYRGDVLGSSFVKVPLMITVPDGEPTGLVFNPTGDFRVGSSSTPATIIFATETGHIAAWNGSLGTTAALAATTTGAVYTGLAIATIGTANFLYAADFKNGRIDVFDRQFMPATLAPGSFVDPKIPAHYQPFNIQNLGGKLYVTYAGAADGVPHGGSGFIDVFDSGGNLLQQLASGGHLKAPWGLALSPANFGSFGAALLVGNLGDGRVSAYDPASGEFLGQLFDASNKPIEIDGLLGLTFGNGVNAGDTDKLYFCSGPNGGTLDGRFGSLAPIPP
jgi:uncharacterized protein (TIGR03118 family)